MELAQLLQVLHDAGAGRGGYRRSRHGGRRLARRHLRSDVGRGRESGGNAIRHFLGPTTLGHHENVDASEQADHQGNRADIGSDRREDDQRHEGAGDVEVKDACQRRLQVDPALRRIDRGFLGGAPSKGVFLLSRQLPGRLMPKRMVSPGMLEATVPPAALTASPQSRVAVAMSPSTTTLLFPMEAPSPPPSPDARPIDSPRRQRRPGVPRPRLLSQRAT